jgi:apolipoprotein D and lipocalin family protein
MCGRLAVVMTLMACTLFGFAGCVCHTPERGVAQTVASVDLGRYVGRWYAVASLPAWFQRNCQCVTAEYSLQKGYVAVVNTCRKGGPDGPLKVSTAKAFVVPETGNSRLKVLFFWPFKGDYSIIALDKEYQYTMVGHPSRKYLWILSRTPSMDEKSYIQMVETAKAKGYDVARLQRIPQGCADAD